MTKRARQFVVSNASVLHPDSCGAFCRPVGVRLTRALSMEGEKTEDPDRRQNASCLFTPWQTHSSQRKICLNYPSHPSPASRPRFYLLHVQLSDVTAALTIDQGPSKSLNFVFSFFEKTQAGADNFTRGPVAPAGDLLVDEALEVIAEIDADGLAHIGTSDDY